jgi:hypothetical protein
VSLCRDTRKILKTVCFSDEVSCVAWCKHFLTKSPLEDVCFLKPRSEQHDNFLAGARHSQWHNGFKDKTLWRLDRVTLTLAKITLYKICIAAIDRRGLPALCWRHFVLRLYSLLFSYNLLFNTCFCTVCINSVISYLSVGPSVIFWWFRSVHWSDLLLLLCLHLTATKVRNRYGLRSHNGNWMCVTIFQAI